MVRPIVADLRERYIEIYKIENKIHNTQLLHGNPKPRKNHGAIDIHYRVDIQEKENILQFF